MKSIMVNKQNGKYQALYHEILEHEGRKFRIVMDIHNGSNRNNTSLSVLLPDGTWGFVVGAGTLDIKLEHYVNCDQQFVIDACYNRVRKTFTNYIKKVYA